MSGQIGAGSADAITAVFAAAMSVTLIALLYPLLKRYALAKPNPRSSHSTPTPQGGGIAVIAAMFVAVGIALSLRWFGPILYSQLRVIIPAVVAMACLGAINDIRPLPVGPRLLLQVIIVAVAIFTLPNHLRIVPLLPWWPERLLLVLGGLWFVNLVNFMDGLDWMTVAEVIPLTAPGRAWTSSRATGLRHSRRAGTRRRRFGHFPISTAQQQSSFSATSAACQSA
jgi:UDP-N-acetylmuramyl pentapeptide phosphotransferase/UDP-N-acetylglucosamine-1-phosphate transferase